MSHPIARRAGMLALTAAMLMPSAGALSDVSNWAQEGVAAAQNAGLAPSSLSNSAASGSITRAEFCAVALNAYKAVSGKAVYVSGKKPFEDCSDPNVTAAYLLGIVKGRTNGNFESGCQDQPRGNVHHARQHPRRCRYRSHRDRR